MTVYVPLDPTASDGMYDLVGIGFGPACLAIAVALHDALEDNPASHYQNARPKVKFLERQAQFSWQAGMLLAGARMQISFIKDLATIRNPRSYFTFLNYLKQHNRLVQFSNLDTFLPLRMEFEDYLKWAASHFQDVVQYSQDVVSVKPVKTIGAKKYSGFEVTSVNVATGVENIVTSKNVVIAVGGRPSIPKVFPSSKRIIHSSHYQPSIAHILPHPNKDYTIAVIGGGQSAAEIFNDLHSSYPNAKTLLIMRDSALRPSDDSPFVNEVFDPAAVDDFFWSDVGSRRAQVEKYKSTNYSVVRLGLLEKIYEDLYHQRIKNPDPLTWQHQILPSREVVEVLQEDSHLNLVLNETSSNRPSTKQLVRVDAIVLATGYIRDVHNTMLKECQMMNKSTNEDWTPGRGYEVALDRGLVEKDVNIYLQGCNEQTHGLSDTLLSILATRGGELVQSIFGQKLQTFQSNGDGMGPVRKSPVHANGIHHPQTNGANGALNEQKLTDRSMNVTQVEVVSNGHQNGFADL